MLYEIVHLKDTYGNLGENGADPTLEIMVQDDFFKDTPRPAILICPGGGYCMTWGGEGQNVAFDYLAIGCNCFILRYSTSPHRYPTQVIEAAFALKYITENSEKFNIDVEKIAIMGFSAGGHVAASYCTLRGNDEILEKIPNPVNVSIALLCYPVITGEEPTHVDSFRKLSGHEVITEEDVEKFSLERHVNSELTPPTFIWCNSDDWAVNPLNSLKYAAALGEKKIPYELHIFPEGKHGVSTGKYGLVKNPESEDIKHLSIWTELACRYIKKYFKI